MEIKKEIYTIEERLEKLFAKRSGVSIFQNPELRNENFFGYTINLPPREAVLLLVDIEKEFGISVSRKFILDKGFTTFQNLLDYLNSVK